MFEIDIPGYGQLKIENLVCDFNGTLAVDGRLANSVKDHLNHIANFLNIYVITADTFGLADYSLRGVNCKLTILPKENQSTAKRDFVQELGAVKTIAIGNGRNDRLMLETAAIGIAILMAEGSAVEAIQASDIICPGINEALALFQEPRRLIAVLRG